MFAVRTLFAKLIGNVRTGPPQASVWAKSPRRPRAAIAVCIGFSFIAASQLVLGWAIDTERIPLRDPIYFDKLALFREHPAFFPGGNSARDKPTTLLFIGSSRTLNAVNAGAAESQLTNLLHRPINAFNFGQAGAGPITNAIYLRRLLKEGVQPDFVLIEVHPVFLAGQRPDPPETRWLLPIRLRRDELPVVRALNFPAASPAVHGPRGYLAPWNEYRFLLVDRYAPFMLMNASRLNGGHESDAHGFTRLHEYNLPRDRARLLALAHGQYTDYFTGFRPTGCGVDGLRDMLEQCRAAGCKAALVLMPESSEWLSWYDPAGLKEVDAVMAKLGAEFGVPVFDTRTWVPDNMSMDGHHLTGLGADLLTDRLTREALAPWMMNTP